MPQNSTSACPYGIEKAKQALKNKGLSRKRLALYLSKDPNSEMTASTVNRFFAGETVRDDNFNAICEYLGLDRNEIAGVSQPTLAVNKHLAPQNEPLTETINIDELVQSARDKIGAYIEELCGTMRVLDMTQPMGLDDIYTSVNIFEKITGRRRLSVEELIENVSGENFERPGLGRVRSERVPGLEAVAKYLKLMILGKPGAGKTTFLKHLALLCMKGRFQEDRIPLFITLKDFAEAPNQPNLFSYLNQIFIKCGLITNRNAGINLVEQLLKQGKLLVLLDGLDEVRETDSTRILKQIQNFTTDYPVNQFVITCRIAAREYTFQKFTEVEIADFELEQIKSFSRKWFNAKNDTVKVDKFVKKLQDDQSIRELASNPLLLTLLCFVFEESAEFPKNRSDLYKHGLDVLLNKWDGKRNIERDQVYKKLSLKRKEDLLSQVAYSTFEQGQYFFKQREIEERIIKYIRNLPECSDDPEVLQLDSEAVLKSIEVQHGLFVERARGIYSFSHLTFHEYFTARRIKEAGEDKRLCNLVDRITETRWREVFLLTVGMLESADTLLRLMKRKIDELVASDEKIQDYLMWVQEHSQQSSYNIYKSTAIRAIYLGLNLYKSDLSLSDTLEPKLSVFNNLLAFLRAKGIMGVFATVAKNLNNDKDYEKAISILWSQESPTLPIESNPTLVLCPISIKVINYFEVLMLDDKNTKNVETFITGLSIPLIFSYKVDSTLHLKLLKLKSQLPQVESEQWLKQNLKTWIQEFKSIVIQYCNNGHDWQFTESQKEILNQYYGANKLLVDCLNSDCYISRDVRKYIEDTLILPIKSIPPMRLE